MKKNGTLSVLFAFVILAVLPLQQDIRLDAVIGNGEWRGAEEYELAGGGRLLMKKQGSDLYIALLAQKKAWSHVYLWQGDTIKVLHASAALGEATYSRQNDKWQPVHAFNWELRETNYNPELVAKQDEYFRKSGWVANNNNMGNGMVFEFKLDLSKPDRVPASLACVVAEIPEELHYFPSTLKDNTLLKKLVQGYTPDSLRFDPSQWHPLR